MCERRNKFHLDCKSLTMKTELLEQVMVETHFMFLWMPSWEAVLSCLIKKKSELVCQPLTNLDDHACVALLVCLANMLRVTSNVYRWLEVSNVNISVSWREVTHVYSCVSWPIEIIVNVYVKSCTCLGTW